MSRFAVRAECGVVGFSPVRALIPTGDTASWPRRARIGLRLLAPDDPACVTVGTAGTAGTAEARRSLAGTAPERGRAGGFHRERVVSDFRAVGRAWLDQVGPCRIDVVDGELLDDGSRLFFETLAEESGGMVTIRCPAGPGGPAPVPAVVSERERRIEYLAGPASRLSGEELDFLYEQAVGYLGTGDGWTAERVLRAALRQRPTPAVRDGLRLARAMLGLPPEGGRPAPARWRDPRPSPTGRPRPPLRLDSGWELLERWSGTAGQIHRNAVHKALFAIADRTVFTAYETFDDTAQPRDFFVLVKGDLILKIRAHDFHAFGIIYVGSVSGAPGISLGADRVT
ncbi:DUF6235 family protein [Streptomyces sp. NPDC051567]|uniref:DUF6235 family protein n=1 Tax=Streptomyces sp. NPDC051567 TaxID=3365660 RepID=UPI003788285F